MGVVLAQPIPREDPEIVDVGREVFGPDVAPVLPVGPADPEQPAVVPPTASGAHSAFTTEEFPFADPDLTSAEQYIAPQWAMIGPAPKTSLLSEYLAQDSGRSAGPGPKEPVVEPVEGSLDYVDLRRPGDPLPFRIPLRRATLAELVEIRYRSGGWKQVDELIDAARLRETELRYLVGALGTSSVWRQRYEEVVNLLVMLREAAGDFAKRVVRPLVQAELLARREVLRRLDTSTALLANDFGRLAPNGRYARYQDWENRKDLTPALLLAELAEHPWEPEVEAPEFKQLASLIDEVARARNWAASVRLSGAASFTASVMASLQGLLAVLDEDPGTVGRSARAAVACIQELADALSGKARTTGPIPPLRALGAMGEEFTLAVDAAQRAAQLVLITETALGAVFPLARRLDTVALAGASADKLRHACADAGQKVASDAATVESELGLTVTSLRHIGEDRADVATGKDSAVRDAFTYPVAVYGALHEAGMEVGSLSWVAAGEAMRARGIPATYMSVWDNVNLASGLASMFVKKAGPAAAVGAAAYSVWDAALQTITFRHGSRTWSAVLEPSLRLIEKDPELSELAEAYGTAFVDVVCAVIEVAPLMALL